MLLVIGASGRVGQSLRQLAEAAGEDRVIFLSRQGGPGLQAWQPGQSLPPARAALVLAGVTAGDAAALSQNAVLAEQVADALIAAQIPLCLYASTQAVYGAALSQGPDEDSPTQASSAYGQSKALAETRLRARLAGSGTRCVMLRLGNVAGADLLGTTLASGREVGLDQFADGGGPERSYLSPADLLRLCLGLAERAGQDLPPVLNVAGAVPVDMADLLRAGGVPFRWQPAPPQAVKRAFMDCGLLARRFPDLMASSRPADLAQGLRLAQARVAYPDITWPKRLFDIALALSMAAILAVPFGLLLLWLLWREGRPLFYVSERMKAPDQPFWLWKLRTMTVVEERANSGVSGADKASRVTPIGKILRRYRLDEIPQLWNVLRGDMSFVGPRPPLRLYTERFPALYGQVLQARPGITGLATLIYHRHEERLLQRAMTAGETDAVYARRCVPRKAALDLIYLRNRSVCYDIVLMAGTLTKVASRKK